eukprot:NODE_13576_length_1158_cov_4.934045.p1 GENE.NODE_13576_length_1158_cov_4.934045~~NODE_13576_length_1158_cov_4.934045.p1  ORF type:complete len:280 (+),score=57.61 NODE_13576_length_1158_cov_4.934045:142-981(+)
MSRLWNFHTARVIAGIHRNRSRSRSPTGEMNKRKFDGWNAAVAPEPLPGLLKLDHIVYEVESVQSACDVFEQITGIRPRYGSKHDALGLHNAIVGLGEGRYIEFLAKSPVEILNAQQRESTPTPVTVLGIDGERPRLATWCCSTEDVGISGLVAELTKLPVRQTFPAEITVQNRDLRGGGHLTWRIAADRHRECPGGDMPLGGILPFLIDWMRGADCRPGVVAPKGCELVALKATHPDVAQTCSLLRLMRADHLITVDHGPRPRLSAVIQHPGGQLVLE